MSANHDSILVPTVRDNIVVALAEVLFVLAKTSLSYIPKEPTV